MITRASDNDSVRRSVVGYYRPAACTPCTVADGDKDWFFLESNRTNKQVEPITVACSTERSCLVHSIIILVDFHAQTVVALLDRESTTSKWARTQSHDLSLSSPFNQMANVLCLLCHIGAQKPAVATSTRTSHYALPSTECRHHIRNIALFMHRRIDSGK
jgi:hypothetical protein